MSGIFLCMKEENVITGNIENNYAKDRNEELFTKMGCVPIKNHLRFYRNLIKERIAP